MVPADVRWRSLIDELFVAAFDNEWLRQLNDQACFRSAERPDGDCDR